MTWMARSRIARRAFELSILIVDIRYLACGFFMAIAVCNGADISCLTHFQHVSSNRKSINWCIVYTSSSVILGRLSCGIAAWGKKKGDRSSPTRGSGLSTGCNKLVSPGPSKTMMSSMPYAIYHTRFVALRLFEHTSYVKFPVASLVPHCRYAVYG